MLDKFSIRATATRINIRIASLVIIDTAEGMEVGMRGKGRIEAVGVRILRRIGG